MDFPSQNDSKMTKKQPKIHLLCQSSFNFVHTKRKFVKGPSLQCPSTVSSQPIPWHSPEGASNRVPESCTEGRHPKGPPAFLREKPQTLSSPSTHHTPCARCGWLPKALRLNKDFILQNQASRPEGGYFGFRKHFGLIWKSIWASILDEKSSKSNLR